jgi:hypothetical protein
VSLSSSKAGISSASISERRLFKAAQASQAQSGAGQGHLKAQAFQGAGMLKGTRHFRHRAFQGAGSFRRRHLKATRHSRRRHLSRRGNAKAQASRAQASQAQASQSAGNSRRRHLKARFQAQAITLGHLKAQAPSQDLAFKAQTSGAGNSEREQFSQGRVLRNGQFRVQASQEQAFICSILEREQGASGQGASISRRRRSGAGVSRRGDSEREAF